MFAARNVWQQLGGALVITMIPAFSCFFIISPLADAAVNHPASFFMFNLSALTATAFPSTAFKFSPKATECESRSRENSTFNGIDLRTS